MWFLNVVLPVVIGSYFVLNFKTLSNPLKEGETKLYKIIMIPIVLFLIILIYCLAILVLIYGFTKVNTTGNVKTKFSIIIPFRDENENLPLLLDSLSRLNYPIDLFK
jgi:hypothetical protein